MANERIVVLNVRVKVGIPSMPISEKRRSKILLGVGQKHYYLWWIEV